MAKSSNKAAGRRPGRLNQAASVSSPIVEVTRHVKEMTRLMLCVRAGGRCEFDGHNAYLLEHPVTLTLGVFAEMAHIVAFSEQGPRGAGVRPADINNIDNLMLLCPACHKLVDDHPDDYPRSLLEGYKREHEERVRHLTDLGSDRKTSVILFKARIAGHTVSVPFDHIVRATFPRYPKTRSPMTIDLTEIADGPSFIETACGTIARRVDRLFDAEGEATSVGHVSVFALGPIPLLICLGRHLTSKVSVDVYQRHRDTEDWVWKADGPDVSYTIRTASEGESDRVAVVLSLSGAVALTTLPQDVRESATIYEMALEGVAPATTFLRTRQNLEAFRIAYHELLGRIGQRHGALEAIDLFPAIPAPIAVLCGRELLPKVHHKLRVYDNDKQKGGFTYQLTV